TESMNGAGRYQIPSAQSGSTAPPPGLSEGELRRLLSGIQGRVVLATDTRRSREQSQRETVTGFCGASDQTEASRLEMAADEFYRELLSEDYGVVVMRTTTASGAGSSASAPAANRPASSGSAFSQAFSEGIHGKAEEDADGRVH